MAPPLAKRQRRSKLVIRDSDDEDEATPKVRQTTLTPERKPSVQTVSRHTRLRKSIESNGNGPASKTTKWPKKSEERGNIKSLHSFFGRATEEQRWTRKVNTPAAEGIDIDDEDAIEDDVESLDNGLLELADTQNDTRLVLDRRKVGISAIKYGVDRKRMAPLSTQKFVKPPTPVKTFENASTRPWAETYGPKTIEELAVHKKKVVDVQKWLGDVFSGRDRRRILVLKGPAGSGKTTTISLLSRSLGFNILPWTNPTVTNPSMPVSIAARFDDFLNRGAQFGALDLDTTLDPSIGIERSVPQMYHVLLVEEFPATITRSSTALESFRTVLRQHLASRSQMQAPLFGRNSSDISALPPIVMIVTESLLTSASSSTDSFTAHRLLGPELSNHPLVTIVEFNPIAPTLITKALEIVIKKEARDSSRRRIPGPAVIRRLSEMGDVRSAVNTLEFLCTRSNDTDDWGGRVAAKAKASGKAVGAMTDMEKDSLELITQREATLGMFHAVGKVLYNKREDPTITSPIATPPPKPPDHLSHLYNPKVTEVDVDDLMNESGIDISTFISTLHENYILSCTSPTSFLDLCAACSSTLSDTDIISPDNRLNRIDRATGSARLASQGYPALDSLRQAELSFHVAVRGMLLNLPYPVSRGPHPSGRKQDSFKMFYPAALRLWRPMEEIDSLISLHCSRLITHDSLATYSTSTGDAKSIGVARWAQSATSSTPSVNPADSASTPRILASRPDVLFDRLPYLTTIRSAADPEVRALARATQFTGLRLPTEDEEDDSLLETVVVADEIMTDKPRVSGQTAKIMHGAGAAAAHAAVASGGGISLMALGEAPLEKLYISDDDIQDD